MWRLLAFVVCAFVAQAHAATKYVCNSATGLGDGSAYSNCAAAGANFASISVSAGDTLHICGPDKIRGALTITSTNNVTVDLACSGGTSGTITGADVASSFTGPDSFGQYTSTTTYAVPFVLLVDGVAWQEGVKNFLSASQWAFNSTNGGTHEVILGSDPTGHTVEVGKRGVAIEFISSTGASVTGGRFEGIAHTGAATGNGAINFRGSSGTVSSVTCYDVRKCVDGTGTSTYTVSNSTISYAGDGLDANKNVTEPSATFTSNTLSEINYNGWFANTATSHNIVVDGEALACTSCAALTANNNTITHANVGLAFRADAATTIRFIGNVISGTTTHGVTSGCSAATGIPNYTVASNILMKISDSLNYPTGKFAINDDVSACGNGTVSVVANNSIADAASGIYVKAATGQTGTITVDNNAIVNINPIGQAGTHYFISWVDTSATNAMTISADNNRYYQTTGAGFFRWVLGSTARAYSAFASYQTDSSQEAHSSTGDTTLTGGTMLNAATDFVPKATSNLLRGGTCPLAVGCTFPDYRGYYPRVPPDVGAIQRGAGDF